MLNKKIAENIAWSRMFNSFVIFHLISTCRGQQIATWFQSFYESRFVSNESDTGQQLTVNIWYFIIELRPCPRSQAN